MVPTRLASASAAGNAGAFVSELVYGPLYRQRSRLSWPDALALAERLAACDGVFVHLTGPTAAVHARLLARDGTAPGLTEIDRLVAAYHRVFVALAAHAPVIQRDLGAGSAEAR